MGIKKIALPINKCLSCGTKRRDGYWKGTITIENKDKIGIYGSVYINDYGLFPVDHLIKKALQKYKPPLDLERVNITQINGQVICPACKSEKYIVI